MRAFQMGNSASISSGKKLKVNNMVLTDTHPSAVKTVKSLWRKNLLIQIRLLRTRIINIGIMNIKKIKRQKRVEIILVTDLPETTLTGVLWALRTVTLLCIWLASEIEGIELMLPWQQETRNTSLHKSYKNVSFLE